MNEVDNITLTLANDGRLYTLYRRSTKHEVMTRVMYLANRWHPEATLSDVLAATINTIEYWQDS